MKQMNENVTEPPRRIIYWLPNWRERTKFNDVWIGLKLLNVMLFMLFLGFSISIHMRHRDNLIFKNLCIDRFQDNYLFCFKDDEKSNISKKNLEVLDVISSSSTHVFAMIGLKFLIECFTACLLCSWSDCCGRKFPLLIALLGENFDISNFFVKDLSFVYFIWFSYILTILSGVFGGYICIFAMAYCYLVDYSSRNQRALAFAMLDVTFTLGIISGVVTFKRLILGDHIFVSFLCILIVRCSIIIWTWLMFVEEKFEFDEQAFLKKIKLMFSITEVKKCFKSLTKWRLNCQSEQLHLLIVSALPTTIQYALIEGVIRSSWIHAGLFRSFDDYEQTTLYLAVYSCFFEAFFILIFLCLCAVKDCTLGIIGCLNLYLNYIIITFAKDRVTFIAGLAVTPLKGLAITGLRSAYSRIGDDTERGKLFFFYSLSEISATFIGYFLYQKLNLVLTPKDNVLPYMVLSTGLMLPLCTFVFQKISIHTDHLFEYCYRILTIQNIPRLTRSSNF